jgi:WD40 repeat protein
MKMPTQFVIVFLALTSNPRLMAQPAKLRMTLGPAQVVDKIRFLAYSPDGKTVALACEENTVKLWDVASRKVKATWAAHEGSIWHVAYSPDGKTLASAGSESAKLGDVSVKLWDPATGKQKALLKEQRGPLAFSRDSKVLATVEFGKVVLWDVSAAKQKTNCKDIYYPEAIALSPDGATLAYSSGKNIKLADTASGKEKADLEWHKDTVWALAFSPDGMILASGSLDETIMLWDAVTGKLKTTWKKTGKIQFLAFGGNGKTLAAATDFLSVGNATLRDVATGNVLTILEGHTHSNCLAFSPDGKTLVALSHDKTLRLWDLATGKDKIQPPGHTNWVTALAFSPDGKTLASGSMDLTVQLRNLGDGKVKTTLQENGPVGSLAFRQEGKTLMVGGGAMGSLKKTGVRAWDLVGGKVKKTFKGDFLSRVMALSPNGKTLAIGEYYGGEKGFPFRGKIKLFDADTGEEQAMLERPDPSWPSGSLAFSPDGKTLAAGLGPFFGHGVVLWDLGTKKRKEIAKGAVNSIAFSPDGKTLAVATDNVRLYDVATGEEKAFLHGHKERGVNAVAFSPDGKTLASASMDNTVKLWDVALAKEKATLTGHSDGVLCVAFSPDGTMLASGSMDKSIRLWDLAKKK